MVCRVVCLVFLTICIISITCELPKPKAVKSDAAIAAKKQAKVIPLKGGKEKTLEKDAHHGRKNPELAKGPKGKTEMGKNEHARKQPCSSRNFRNVNTCCKKLPGAFFPSHVIDMCDQGKNALSKLLSHHYVINKLHDANRINFCNKEEEIGPMACMATCFFQQYNLIPNGEVDYNAARRHFHNMVTDPVWHPKIDEALDMCKIVAEGEFVQSVRNPSTNKKCETEPMILLQCMRKYFITECPEGLSQSAAGCDTNIKAMKRCNAFKLDVMEVMPTEESYQPTSTYGYTTWPAYMGTTTTTPWPTTTWSSWTQTWNFETTTTPATTITTTMTTTTTTATTVAPMLFG